MCRKSTQKTKMITGRNFLTPVLLKSLPIRAKTGLLRSLMIIPADVMAEDFDVRNVVACTMQLQTFRVSFSAGLELTGYLSMTM